MDRYFLTISATLNHDGVVELPQVQAGELFDLFQPVDQGVAVDEQAAAGLGHVQVVLEKALDGEQGLLVQALDAALLEHLLRNISQTVVGSW